MRFERFDARYGHFKDTAGATLVVSRGPSAKSVEDGAVCFGEDGLRAGTCYLAARVDDVAETRRLTRGDAGSR
jgi:hypothetical protein